MRPSSPSSFLSSPSTFLFIQFQRLSSSFFQDNPSCPVKITSSITMHFSTLATLAAAFASVAYAIPTEADEAATEATKDIQHYYARYITSVATGTNLDLYKGESCPKDGKPVPVNGWYFSPISLP
jgi:hypothetical protein